MKVILATKGIMTRVFDDNGHVVPVTRVHAGPCYVTQVKTKEKDGVNAVQVGFGVRKKAVSPQVGQSKAAMAASGRTAKSFRTFREFRIENPSEYSVGQEMNVTAFQAGDRVKVSGTSKGRGFQGVVKRHHFSGSPATHGHKDQLRMPGSIGSGHPQKVFKGKRMGGRMGNDRVTVRGLRVIKVEPETHELWINGALPGSIKSLLEILG